MPLKLEIAKTGTRYTSGDIIAVSVLDRIPEKPPTMRKTRYIYANNEPPLPVQDYMTLAISTYNPPIDQDDPHSGGFKHYRLCCFEYTRYAQYYGVVLHADDAIVDNWANIQPFIKNKETNQPAEIPTK